MQVKEVKCPTCGKKLTELYLLSCISCGETFCNKCASENICPVCKEKKGFNTLR